MVKTRKVYTDGDLSKRYCSVRECGNGLKLIEGGRASSYSSRCEKDICQSSRLIFMIIFLFAAYVTAAGLNLL